MTARSAQMFTVVRSARYPSDPGANTDTERNTRRNTGRALTCPGRSARYAVARSALHAGPLLCQPPKTWRPMAACAETWWRFTSCAPGSGLLKDWEATRRLVRAHALTVAPATGDLLAWER